MRTGRGVCVTFYPLCIDTCFPMWVSGLQVVLTLASTWDIYVFIFQSWYFKFLIEKKILLKSTVMLVLPWVKWILHWSSWIHTCFIMHVSHCLGQRRVLKMFEQAFVFSLCLHVLAVVAYMVWNLLKRCGQKSSDGLGWDLSTQPCRILDLVGENSKQESQL